MPRTKFDLSLLPQQPNLHFEQILWGSGLAHLAGIDEAGRGALAGPVCAAAAILPNRPDLLGLLPGVNDSKQMSAQEREYWASQIQTIATSYGVGFASAAEIDEVGIVPATRLAAMRALAQCRPAAQHLLIDAISIPGAGLPETSLIKGDARSLSIAAASVLAKTARDACMREMDASFPAYGLAQHKGYGTARHLKAIETHGACREHRKSFAPFRLDEAFQDEDQAEAT
jgi:ribonuclease HII